MKIVKAGLVFVGCYGANIAAWFGFLVLGAIFAGKGTRSGEIAVAVTLLLTALGFLAGTGALYWGLGRVEVLGGSRVGLCIGYGLLALVTLAGLFMATALVMNR